MKSTEIQRDAGKFASPPWANLRKSLDTLKVETDNILHQLNPKDFPDEAITWDKVKCIEAIHCIVVGENGVLDKYWSVVLYPCSPDSRYIFDLICDELVDWLPYVEVRGGW